MTSDQDIYWPARFPEPIYYPESDGRPMAETDVHWKQTVLLKYGIELKLRDVERKYVGSDLLMYYVQGEPKNRVAPDVFVVMGAEPGDRRTWRVWDEERAPDVVFEVSSRGTHAEDLGVKKGVYEFLGVKEYFLIDPEHDYLDPPLQGFRLGGDGYVRMVGAIGSELLGLAIERHDDLYRLRDTATGALLPTPVQAFEEYERERERAEQERERAEQERERAEQERERADRAEAELARLRAQLAAQDEE